jgi:hypothetical protein
MDELTTLHGKPPRRRGIGRILLLFDAGGQGLVILEMENERN